MRNSNVKNTKENISHETIIPRYLTIITHSFSRTPVDFIQITKGDRNFLRGLYTNKYIDSPFEFIQNDVYYEFLTHDTLCVKIFKAMKMILQF